MTQNNGNIGNIGKPKTLKTNEHVIVEHRYAFIVEHRYC